MGDPRAAPSCFACLSLVSVESLCNGSHGRDVINFAVLKCDLDFAELLSTLMCAGVFHAPAGAVYAVVLDEAVDVVARGELVCGPHVIVESFIFHERLGGY